MLTDKEMPKELFVSDQPSSVGVHFATHIETKSAKTRYIRADLVPQLEHKDIFSLKAQTREAIKVLIDKYEKTNNNAFERGDKVRKKGKKGQWHGVVCGEYSTSITPEGYAVESVYEKGSVQIYPVSALEFWTGRMKND